ncbi:MAG TPA: hypothetical protein VH234_00785, partial [Candidatus Saccharimonadales bacterium]|nr:hypothetical protein [Candidatus Saccharimonadales bacterium]
MADRQDVIRILGSAPNDSRAANITKLEDIEIQIVEQMIEGLYWPKDIARKLPVGSITVKKRLRE